MVHGKLPEEWRDRPEIDSSLNWIFTAFSELSTCRSIGFAPGPIPWTAIRMYASDAQLDDDEYYHFKRCISKMDSVYLAITSDPEGKDGKQKGRKVFRK